jgi:N-acetylglucosamine repressor
MVNRSNDLREHNKKAIMKEILSHQQISRQRVIERTGLASSTVSSIIKEILDENILRKSGQLNSSGTGRRTDLFLRNGKHARILVANLTFESNRIALVDLELNLLAEKELPLKDFHTEKVAQALLEEMTPYLNDESAHVQSIVLALPHYPYKKDLLKSLLCEKLDLPVFTINNVEAMGMYDSHYLYPETSFNSLFYIFIGKGIGSAFFHKGELLVGENGYASDLGHIHITDHPITCRCGRSGCLETVSSEESMIRSLLETEKLLERKTGGDLVSYLKTGIDKRDEEITGLVDRAANYLAEAILTVNSLLDPQTMILTGHLVELNPYFSLKMEESLYKKAGRRSLFDNKLIYQRYQPASTVKGAALYAFLSAYSG